MFKRSLCFLLALVLFGGVLTGCGDTGKKSAPGSPGNRRSSSAGSSEYRGPLPERPIAEKKPPTASAQVNADAPNDRSDHDDVEDTEQKGKNLPKPQENVTPHTPEKNLNFDEYRTESAKIMSRLKECREKLAMQKISADNMAAMRSEIERVDGIMNDSRYVCFDRCINLEGIVFHRVMKRHKVQPSMHGYYHTINWQLSHKEKRKWNHVPVTYTCLDHNITWTEAEAENYRQNHYVPLPRLEEEKAKLEKSLAQAKRKFPSPDEVNKLEKEIADLKAQLSFLRRKYGITDVDVEEERAEKQTPKFYSSNFMVDLPGDVKLAMVKVAAWSFMMGARDGENGKDEVPHRVTLTRDFYIGRTEVTQAQWKAVMGNNPSHFRGDDLPVERVSWDDAMDFCEKLNEMDKAPDGWKFTLPTEAQWEYAARGGKKSRGYKYSGSYNRDNVAWCDSNSGGKTHPVATKQANELGLYDMSGNLKEWCLDWYEEGYAADPETLVGNSGSKRVCRGGCWRFNGKFCRSADRFGSSPDLRSYYLGFRLALVPNGSPRQQNVQDMRGTPVPENDPQNSNGQTSDSPRRVRTDKMSKSKFVMKPSETRYFPKKYSPPYTIRAQCKTNGVALRFLLMDGEILFKWGNNYNLRVNVWGVRKNLHFDGKNDWSDIEIKVTETELSVHVNGVLRCSGKGDFKNKKSRIGVRTLRVGDPKSTVSVKQLTVSY